MPTTARKFTINKHVRRRTKDCCHLFPRKIEFSHFYLVKRIKRTFTCECKSRRWNVNEKTIVWATAFVTFFWKIWLTYWRKTLNLIMLFKLNLIKSVSNSYNGIFCKKNYVDSFNKTYVSLLIIKSTLMIKYWLRIRYQMSMKYILRIGVHEILQLFCT